VKKVKRPDNGVRTQCTLNKNLCIVLEDARALMDSGSDTFEEEIGSLGEHGFCMHCGHLQRGALDVFPKVLPEIVPVLQFSEGSSKEFKNLTFALVVQHGFQLSVV
jgi:hypothetical protein